MRLFTDVSETIAEPHLREAFLLAERGRGATAPNPLVGCVIVSPQGAVVGRGFHPQAGQPHAEVFALAEAGERARGATAFVTLEPCAHHGRTPPCADALIAAGVGSVVVGMRDPNPEARGGVERLRASGVEVELADDLSPFEEQNEGWLKRVAAGTPLVRVKLALSLDAKPAFLRGERASITGDSGAEITRRLRAAADAVVVSAATVDADDPALTVRDATGTRAERQALRVVLVREHLPRPDARLFSDGLAPTVVLVPEGRVPEARGVLPHTAIVESYDAERGLEGAFAELGRRGLSEVLVEPGPRLFSAMWVEGLVDELVSVVAGGMAGHDAPSVFGGPEDRLGSALRHVVAPIEAGIVGDVAVTVWRPAAAR